MKRLFLLTAIAVSLFCSNVYSQIQVKTEYLAPRRYENNNKEKTSGYGSTMSTSIDARTLIGMERSKYMTPKLWFMTMSSSYTSLHNSREAKAALPNEVSSFDLGVQHIRPLRDNLTLVSGLSAGVYATHASFSDLRMHNIVGTAYGSLVWDLGNGLELGFGLVFNNALKYPVPIPAPYLKWYREFGRGFLVDIDMGYKPKFAFGYKFSDHARITVVNRPIRYFGYAKENGKDRLFEHAYVTVAIEPEFKFGNVTFPITIGGNFARVDRYRTRTPLTFYHFHSPNFNPSFYGAVGFRYTFAR